MDGVDMDGIAVSDRAAIDDNPSSISVVALSV